MNLPTENSSKEDADILRDQQQITTEFSLIIAQLHVALQVRPRVSHEKEVSVTCTTLTANPERPEEDEVKVRNRESKCTINRPCNEVDDLECRWDPRVFECHLLQRRERKQVTEVVSSLEHRVLMCENVWCINLVNSLLNSWIRFALFLHLLNEFGFHSVAVNHEEHVEDEIFEKVD